MHLLKKYILLLILFPTLTSIFANTNAVEEVKFDSTSFQSYDTSQYIRLADSVINFSKKYLGTPYRGGGKGPNSFDCSGFTSFVFNNFGIKLGSSSADQAEKIPTVCEREIKPGDLVFYNGRARGHRVGHVGLVVSTDESGNFSFIHSASSVGISISNSSSEYYRRRFVKAGRILSHDSLLARTFTLPVDNLAQNLSYTSVAPISINEGVGFQTVIKHKHIPAKYHTVKSGETLSGIAAKYGTTVSNLKRNNKLQSDFLALKQRIKITDSKRIEVEEKVAIANTSISEEDKVKEVSGLESQSVHTIKKGETLFSISKQYGVSVSELEKLNSLEKGKIFPGQVLKLKYSEPSEKLLTNEVETEEIDQQNDEKSIASVEIKKISKQKPKSHTVKKGESLSEIAEKYHCSVSQIKSWNAKKSNNINAGEKLMIKI